MTKNGFDRILVPLAREVEVYHCRCRIRFCYVDYGEAKECLLKRPMLVSDCAPCSKHKQLTGFLPETLVL